MTGRFSAALVLMTAALLPAGAACATDSGTTRQTVTIGELFPPEQARAFAPTMRTDKKVTFRVHVPPGPAPHGLLVFVHPGFNAEPMTGWTDVLDRRNLAYVAAEGFGNDKPGNQRALAALLGLTQMSRTQQIDGTRRYIAGMSGGGKMASQVLARFPDFFDGALCIVGADFPARNVQRAPAMAGKRVVFMTGDQDFNHYDVLDVYRRFVAAGITGSHLMDIEGFGHQYPDAQQLDAALELLDPVRR